MMFMPVVFVLIMAWGAVRPGVVLVREQPDFHGAAGGDQPDHGPPGGGGRRPRGGRQGQAEQGRLETKTDGREVSDGGAAGPLAEALSGVEPPVFSGGAGAARAPLPDAPRLEGSGGSRVFVHRKTLRATTFGRRCNWGRLLPERGPFLDIGSGGGTPALPLAIAGGGNWGPAGTAADGRRLSGDGHRRARAEHPGSRRQAKTQGVLEI